MMSTQSTETRKRRRGHNEEAIYQRNDGRWVAALSLSKDIRKSLYSKTRKEATDKIKHAMSELDAGLDLNAGRHTVARYLDQWLGAGAKPSVKTRTFEFYESIVRVRVVQGIGRKQLSKLTALDLQDLYSELTDSELTARSVHHTHRGLHRAFGQAVKWNLIARNPCAGATAPKTTSTEMRVLTPEQARAFLAGTAEHPSHALYVLAITTGMRAGELLGLKWEDIDLDAELLSVKRALQQQNGGKGLVNLTKPGVGMVNLGHGQTACQRRTVGSRRPAAAA